MRSFPAIAFAALLTASAMPGKSDAPLPAALQILGNVTAAARPVADALVIALDLGSFQSIQTYSGADGSFVLPALRSGVYKIIAIKHGFAPTIATVLPTTPDRRVMLRLQQDKQQQKKNVSQELWEIRGSLPPDILRELDLALESATALVTYEIPRLRGEMVSMTGVTDQASNPAFAQTALGVQGRIGENWQLGIRGKLQRFEDTSDDAVFGEPLAQSRAMSMELRSSPTEVYRVASTMSSWQYAKDIEPGDRQVDVRAHDFEWEHGAARVQVHYFAQANLFRSTPGGSDRIEIAGDTTLLQTRRSDLGVALRVTQESLHSGGERLRSADVAANASYELHPSLVMHYGMAGRFGIESRELAPHTGAEWKVTKNTSVVGSAMVKVMNQRDAMFLPRTMIWTDDEHMLPRYAYSFGVVSGSDGNNRVSAIVTYTLVDTPMRVLFADGTERFWDGMQVDSGDARRDIRLAYRREFGRNFAVDVSTTAGKARARTAILPAREKFYVAGDLQSTFTPTRTSLAVSYREIQQPADTSGAGTDYVSERVNLRMAQSLYLPIDVKILLGLELARAENSPFLLDTGLAVGASRRYIGGVALNF